MKVNITKAHADRLIHQFHYNIWVGDQAVRNAFWNGLNADERKFMENYVHSLADAAANHYAKFLDSYMVEVLGQRLFEQHRDDIALTFAPEPSESNG